MKCRFCLVEFHVNWTHYAPLREGRLSREPVPGGG
jgi:hypothetical protein